MILHALREGGYVVRVSAFEFFANFLMNLLLIFGFGLGFEGSYLGTLICSWLVLTLTIRRVSRQFSLNSLLSPQRDFVRALLLKAGAEALRLISERSVAFVLLWFFASQTLTTGSSAALGAFSVGTEVLFFLSVPMIAAMRASAVQLAQVRERPHSELLGSLLKVLMAGGLLSLLVLACVLPVKFLDSFLRSVFQAKQEFQFLAKVDFSLQWLVLLPLVAWGVHRGSPGWTWLGYLLIELASLAILASRIWLQRRREILLGAP
jgi:Na+-driven multidrug efflux pump